MQPERFNGTAERTRPAPPRHGLVLLAALATALTAGCVSIRAERPAPHARNEPGSVEVRVFDTASDARHGTLTRRRVQSELSVIESSGDETLVHRSWEPSWGTSGLPAGAYRLRVTGWRDASGAYHEFAAGDELRFTLAEDAAASFSVVLRSGQRAAANLGMFVVGLFGCAYLEANGFSCH
jgi:hypothetical protein